MLNAQSSAACAPAAEREALERLEQRLGEALRNEILVRPRVALVAPGTLPVSEDKAKRVIDARHL